MTPQTLLVPIDFSEASEAALDYACSLAAKLGATVHIVNALDVSMPELNAAISDAMLRSLLEGHEAALAKLVDRRRALVTIGKAIVHEGDPRDAIVAAAEMVGADLIVMATHGRRGLKRIVMGSVAEDVSRHAPCPVLLVRARGTKAAAP